MAAKPHISEKMKPFLLYFAGNFLAVDKVFKPENPYLKSNSNATP